MIALQIKSGTSFFTEETTEAYIYRTESNHISYWINHSMPVVLLLFNPDTREMYWQAIYKDTVECTGKRWKVTVPKANCFNDPEQTLRSFSFLTQPELYIRRLNRLRIDCKWMRLIAEGNEVRVEFDDWVNKSLPRYKITISTDTEEEKWPMLYTPGIGIESMLEHFFPWADYSIDEDQYMEYAQAQWSSECYSWRDDETGEIHYSESFEDWYQPPDSIIPISDNGETESYSLILTLNNFGKNFLEIDGYLNEENIPEQIGFELS